MAVFGKCCLLVNRNLAEACTLSARRIPQLSWLKSVAVTGWSRFHTSPTLEKKKMESFQGPTKWLEYNNIVYPPQKPGDPKRPAEVCHMRANIKYSPDKMWYIASMIRGMSIDEALKQLSFYKRKGSAVVKEILEEAQEMAVRDHNVEYESNLWVESSFSGKGIIIKGLRKHRGPRFGIIHYRYCHYFVRLREGKPPKHYYPPPATGFEQMEEYLQEQRNRRILLSL